MDHLLTRDQKLALIDAARAAVTQSFLTGLSGVRYGAAVRSATGQVFTAGQYSSFNHSTNVHAEQAALIAATMAGHADVVALAVVSTGADAVTTPCGVCRQVMLEHASRTGRDFLVLMAAGDDVWEESTVSGLLPLAWLASTQGQAGRTDSEPERAGPATGMRREVCPPLRAGDHIRLREGILALVWDPNPWGSVVLAKLKYVRQADGAWTKFSHAFSGPARYERELLSIPSIQTADCGATVACVRPEQIESVLPMRPLAELTPEFARCLATAGLAADSVFLSGSRSTGMSHDGSDFDIVVHATPNQARELRLSLAQALCTGRLEIPSESGTWRMLQAVYPGGREALLRQQAFAETIKDGDRRFSIMLCHREIEPPLYGHDATFCGLTAAAGEVVDSRYAAFKRASFRLRSATGVEWHVVSFHKLANAVRQGDRIAVRGWLIRDGSRSILLQFHAHRENIIWYPPSTITRRSHGHVL